MSTSSSNSSQPSLDVSVNSGGTTSSVTTPDRSLSTSQSQMSGPSPYITPDFYIIRVSMDTNNHEIEGWYIEVILFQYMTYWMFFIFAPNGHFKAIFLT